MFSNAYGRQGYMRSPFRAAQGDMFQKMIDEIYSGMPNVISTAGDILIAAFNEQSIDYEKILHYVFWICRQATLELNKDKYFIRYTSSLFLGEVISQGLSSDPRKKKQIQITYLKCTHCESKVASG